jgi:phospholipase/lecithinase/hemolysin
MVRQVAEDRRTPLADVASRMDAVSEHGIPGRSLFLDHVHPTIDGNRLVAETILATLTTHDLVDLPEDWGPERADRVAQRIEASLDPPGPRPGADEALQGAGLGGQAGRGR